MGSQEAIEPSVKYTPVEDTQVEDTPAGDNLEEDSDSLVPSLTSCNSHVSMLLSVEDSEEKLEELELSAGDSRRSIVRSLTSRNSHISKDDKENGAMKPKLDEESTSLLTTSIGESNSQCFKKNLELELSIPEINHNIVCNQDKDMSVRASIRDEPHRLSQQILNSSTNCTKVEYMENSFHEIQPICQDSMKKIELLQRLRIQRSIVIVTDEREYLNPDWISFGDDVKVLRIPSMKLGSVFPIIAMNPYFGKNTIWVFSGGINDILEQFPLRDCSEYSCSNPQTMLRLSRTMGDTSCLIKLSMQLNLNILHNTSNDIALFIGLIPVCINQYNQFTLRNRSCFSIHPARPIVTNTCLHFVYYNEYSKTVNLYNCFVEFHARSLGYSPWSLEKTENGENISLINLLQIDGYSIPWVKENNIRVSLLCDELLLMSSLTYEKRKRSIILQGLHWKLKYECLRKFFEEFGEVEMIGSSIANHGLFILFRSESTVVNVLKKDSTFVIEGITLSAKGFINDLFTFSKASNPSSTNGGVSNLLAKESQKNQSLKQGVKESSTQLALSMQNLNLESSKEIPDALDISIPDINQINKWEARLGSQEAIEPSVKYTPVEDTQVEDTPAEDNLEEDSDSLAMVFFVA